MKAKFSTSAPRFETTTGASVYESTTLENIENEIGENGQEQIIHTSKPFPRKKSKNLVDNNNNRLKSRPTEIPRTAVRVNKLQIRTSTPAPEQTTTTPTPVTTRSPAFVQSTRRPKGFNENSEIEEQSGVKNMEAVRQQIRTQTGGHRITAKPVQTSGPPTFENFSPAEVSTTTAIPRNQNLVRTLATTTRPHKLRSTTTQPTEIDTDAKGISTAEAATTTVPRHHLRFQSSTTPSPQPVHSTIPQAFHSTTRAPENNVNGVNDSIFSTTTAVPSRHQQLNRFQPQQTTRPPVVQNLPFHHPEVFTEQTIPFVSTPTQAPVSSNFIRFQPHSTDIPPAVQTQPPQHTEAFTEEIVPFVSTATKAPVQNNFIRFQIQSTTTPVPVQSSSIAPELGTEAPIHGVPHGFVHTNQAEFLTTATPIFQSAPTTFSPFHKPTETFTEANFNQGFFNPDVGHFQQNEISEPLLSTESPTSVSTQQVLAGDQLILVTTSQPFNNDAEVDNLNTSQPSGEAIIGGQAGQHRHPSALRLKPPLPATERPFIFTNMTDPKSKTDDQEVAFVISFASPNPGTSLTQNLRPKKREQNSQKKMNQKSLRQDLEGRELNEDEILSVINGNNSTGSATANSSSSSEVDNSAGNSSQLFNFGVMDDLMMESNSTFTNDAEAVANMTDSETVNITNIKTNDSVNFLDFLSSGNKKDQSNSSKSTRQVNMVDNYYNSNGGPAQPHNLVRDPATEAEISTATFTAVAQGETKSLPRRNNRVNEELPLQVEQQEDEDLLLDQPQETEQIFEPQDEEQEQVIPQYQQQEESQQQLQQQEDEIPQYQPHEESQQQLQQQEEAITQHQPHEESLQQLQQEEQVIPQYQPHEESQQQLQQGGRPNPWSHLPPNPTGTNTSKLFLPQLTY